ncbi:MAG: AraC family transcriptional regulator [Acholeplasmatales bacterium]|nr:MAG: AraC family transcriptional regulator [Acholeplasmatales bacterium]
MWHGPQVDVLLHESHSPAGFAKDSLFHYRNFYQLQCNDEYSTSFNTAEAYYLFYINSGSLFVTLNNQIYSLTRNDLLVVKKKTQVTLSASQSNLYVVEFDGKLAADYMHEIIEPGKQGRSIVDFSNIVMFFVRLKELSAYEIMNEAYVSLNLEAILVEIYARKYYDTDIENPQNYAIIQALFFIEQNIAKKITLEGLAGFVGYSVYHFSRLFKKEVGIPPYEYVIKFRLDLAKHMLITTKKPVKDIAKACGYQSEINFYNIFRKNMGTSPNQFRQKNHSEVKA